MLTKPRVRDDAAERRGAVRYWIWGQAIMLMSQTQAHRLAASIGALRPDWPLASLSKFIATKLTEKSYRDAAVALAWVATDEQTVTPARVLENGPWWRAATAGEGTVSAITNRCPEHPANTAWNCPDCDSRAAPGVPDQFRAVRAALPHRQVTHRQPKPPATDEQRREAIRQTIDREASE